MTKTIEKISGALCVGRKQSKKDEQHHDYQTLTIEEVIKRYEQLLS